MTTTPATSLRYRKKQQQRRHIQRCAVKLFLRNGYTQTAIAQIADTAEISPATFFNYFSTKESVVFDALMDFSLADLLEQQAADTPFIDAVYAGCRSLLSSLPEQDTKFKEDCFTLISTTPELREGLVRIIGVEGIDFLAAVIAMRAGRQPDDLQVRVLAGSIAGTAIAILLESEDCSATHCIERFCAALKELGPELRRI